MTRSGDRAKRAFDVVVGSAVLVLSMPIQAAVAIAIRRSMGAPVLFRQLRPGKDGVAFELIKFRTMRHPDASHVTDEERLTPLGSFLRSTSLDELPSLLNVLRGEMSLVGPRPLLVEYLPHYSPDQLRRHSVRPGITGLAQISGRNSIPWEAKFAKDLEYVDGQSFWMDLKILIATIMFVLRRKGITGDGEATARRFVGCDDLPGDRPPRQDVHLPND
ncbi:sugar transferase [Nostocoides sp. F2B08]|uniref:sugar transferase n=1 Tax=Nostocoides sp. F2B08 TaxID=2653936 RepID=UPI0012638383|nr:sugar transferase [Tetrasphaera sp. F2B08]KAB7743352.1 sugar transferase [Tetrasphaera sp. F2B08]